MGIVGSSGVWLVLAGVERNESALVSRLAQQFSQCSPLWFPRSPGGQASACQEALLPVSLSSAGLAHRWLPHRAGVCKDTASCLRPSWCISAFQARPE